MSASAGLQQHPPGLRLWRVGGPLSSRSQNRSAAQAGVLRATALTHRLLASARRQPLDPKPISPNRLIVEMEELVRRSVGPAIKLDTVLADVPPSVFGTPC